ncbi:MAG: hypothetical protein ACF8XB_00900 [Planctomycetota bacterium JB042]
MTLRPFEREPREFTMCDRCHRTVAFVVGADFGISAAPIEEGRVLLAVEHSGCGGTFRSIDPARN